MIITKLEMIAVKITAKINPTVKVKNNCWERYKSETIVEIKNDCRNQKYQRKPERK